MKNSSITIVTVATDRYIAFWAKLFESALEYIDAEIKVEWILFTNKGKELTEEHFNSRIRVKVVYQESLKWPFPTLFRYRFISQNSGLFHSDIIMHLDADMLFVAPLRLSDLNSEHTDAFIKLIPHPGYFRPRGTARKLLYICDPRIFFRDIKVMVIQGSIGAWENRKISLAFVPRIKREIYFCGGTWFGTRELILKMSEELSFRVDEDLKKGLIAVYHDESHLNWYASEHEVQVGSPSMCHEPTYPQLSGVKPIIQVVNKSSETKWIR